MPSAASSSSSSSNVDLVGDFVSKWRGVSLALSSLNSLFSRRLDFFASRSLAGSAYDRRNSRANEAAPRENSSDKFAGTGRVSVPASPRVMTPLFHVYSIAVLKLRPGRARSAPLPAAMPSVSRRTLSRDALTRGNNNIKRK